MKPLTLRTIGLLHNTNYIKKITKRLDFYSAFFYDTNIQPTIRDNMTKHILSPEQKLMRYATFASVGVASIIILVKVIAWYYTSSLGILSSLADSVMDIIVSIMNLFAVKYAIQPADEDHRFGHGKAEDIAALIQSVFIFASAIFIVFSAINRFVTPQPINHSDIGIYVMVFSTIVTIFLVAYQRYVAKRTKSTVVQADSMHYVGDIAANIAVIITLVAYYYNDSLVLLDPLIAIVIAGIILKSSIGIAKQSFDNLMDKEFSDEERKDIIDDIVKHQQVKGVHDLRTRSSGLKPFIQFHLELDGDLTLRKAHKISDAVEESLLKLYPNAEIIVHQDPEDEETPSINTGGVKAIHNKN